MVCVEIDELTPCLRDSNSGELVPTIVKRVKDKKLLKNFTEDTGWHTNWESLFNESEIYALYVKGNDDVQGLVSMYPDASANAMYIVWMCAAPHNQGNDKKYIGTGGHLFAVVSERSFHYGLNGDMYGFASCESLFEHYMETFHAVPIKVLHDYHFGIFGEVSKEFMEIYDYDYESTPSRNKN